MPETSSVTAPSLVALSLGANIGNRIGTLRQAVRMIEQLDGVSELKVSGLYRTAPVGYTPQPEFINCAATLRTTSPPEQLLQQLRGIEQALGRQRRERWREREIDIDILVFDQRIIVTPTLVVPHPEMSNRAFVLVPLAEIAPSLRHPIFNATVAELLDQLQDKSGVERMEDGHEITADAAADLPRHIAVEGVIGAGKTTLATELAKRLEGRLVLEQFEENPFLPHFYRDPERHAFQTQIFFLLSRYRQQEAFRQPDLFHRTIVSDYLFDKDRIFASLTLSDHELALYDNVVTALEPSVPKPDVVIYLQSSVERLMANIQKRGRAMEREITAAYLEQLSEAYTRYLLRYTAAPVLIVNTDQVDLANDPEALPLLLQSLGAARAAGATPVLFPSFS